MKSNFEPLTRPISLGMIVRLLNYLRPFKKQYAIVCMLGIVMAVLEMIPPKLVGQTIDQMTSGTLSMKSVWIIALYWSLNFLAVQVFHSIQILFANRYGESVVARMRLQIFEHLQHLPMSYFDRVHVGKIIARVSNDIDTLRGILIWGANTLVCNSAIMILASIMIFMTDHRIFIAVAWLAPMMTLLNFIYGKKVGAAWQRVRRHAARVHSNQAENITGMKVVAAFNRQEHNLDYFGDLQDMNTLNNVQASKLVGTFQPILQWIRFTGQAIILLYGGYRVSVGTLGPGALVAISIYWEWFMQPATTFGTFFNELLIAMAGAERIFSLLDQKTEMETHSIPTPTPPLRGQVRFEEVSFGYLPNRLAIRDVSFNIKEGSTVALVGATGSGKSTILSLLARFYRPVSGRILIDGHDLQMLERSSFHQQIAMAIQSNYLFRGTVMDNLRYVRPNASDREIVAAAQEMGCHERFVQLKEGYATPVGERGASLSLGERQLICMTRALVADPRILLLDEVTSSVDPLTELQIQLAFKRLVKNRTTFIVAHRLSTITHSNVILMLDHGQIIEAGTHQELLSMRGKYAVLHDCAKLTNEFKFSLPNQFA